jgi:quercetin dioxygenase-like cupin family protein
MLVLALFIVHNALNFRWYKTIGKGRYTKKRYGITIVNILLAVTAMVLLVSGIMHSKELFGLATEDENSVFGAWQIHVLAAYWMFVLVSVHLGIYWSTVISKFWPSGSRIAGSVLRLTAFIAALFGIYACMSRNLGFKLILYYSFDFWHTSEPLFSYIASYLAIMILFCFITYYLLKVKKNIRDVTEYCRIKSPENKKEIIRRNIMKKLAIIFLSAFTGALTVSGISNAQNQPKEQIIVRSEQSKTTQGSAQFFTGKAFIQSIAPEISPSRNVIAYVTFEAGARSHWHDHDAGQTLVVTSGTAWTQEWNGKAYAAQAGDVIYCPPGIKHFHGASPNGQMTHVSIVENIDGKNVNWMEPVTDDQYQAAGRLIR